MKMFEYIGYGKPILASAGSLAGAFVEAEEVGWTIPYSAESGASLVEELATDPGRILSARAGALRAAAGHTWLARARQVAEELTALR